MLCTHKIHYLEVPKLHLSKVVHSEGCTGNVFIRELEKQADTY